MKTFNEYVRPPRSEAEALVESFGICQGAREACDGGVMVERDATAEAKAQLVGAR